MENKLMWFFALLVMMMVATISAEYFFSGGLNQAYNLAYLLGTMLGTAIAWLIISGPRKRWIYWVSTLSWVLLIPGVSLGLVRYIASLLSIKITTSGYIAIYLLGAMVMFLFFIRTRPRAEIEEIYNRPVIDERYKFHFGLSGFWSFLFLNLLIIGVLLQPWVPQGQIGLWIGVLITGLVFWIANLVILERKR